MKPANENTTPPRPPAPAAAVEPTSASGAAAGTPEIDPPGGVTPWDPDPAVRAAESAPAPGTVRLRLDIAYDGTDFSGWAAQPGRRTVCGELQDTLAQVLRAPITLVVAGRTDAGVHASGQVAHCDVPEAALQTRSIAGDPRTLVRRMARLLPDDVSIRAASFAPEYFDARFSALRRHYEYRLSTEPAGPLPTRARDTAAWSRPVDLAAVRQASALLVGLHDFAAFCRHREGATTIREMQRFEWREQNEPGGRVLVAEVVADAFCWSMVRSLVGAVMAVGEGRREPAWIAGLLAETTRSSSVPVAEARGLTLVRVDYPGGDALRDRQLVTRGLRA